MTNSRTVFRFALLALGLLGILVIQGARVTSAAPPTELFFSEYLESQPGNRKAVEIYNGTGSAITLTGVYNVAVYANGSTSPTSIALTGSIPAGGVFVLAHTDTPAATGITADQTSGSLTFNGDDAVALRNGTTLVDVIGQIGTDPGTEWGTGLASTVDNTIRRKSTICAGDTDGSDAFDPATEWDGYADGTVDGFGSHSANCSGPTDLFFSEYLESQPGNRKAVEIYNGTGSTITLTGVYNVAVYANGSTSPTSIALTGSIPAGGVFVLAHTDTPAATGITADQTSGSLTFNGDDAVALRNGTTLVDVIGQIGTDPGTEWGTGLASTVDNTIRRKSTICAGDTDGTDAFDPATEWDGYADGTVDGFGSHTANCGGGITLSINDVTLNEGNAGTTLFQFTVSLSAAAPTGGVTFDIATADNTAVAPGDYAITTLTGQTIPEGLTTYNFPVLVNGDATTEGNETFFVNITNVTGDGVTVTDGQGLGTIVNDDASLSFIHDVQGSGAASPLDGQLVTIEGIVVGDFQDTTADPPNELNGYFVQEEDDDADADSATSEGIFVFEGANPTTTPAVAVGDKVRVTGTVDEFGDAPDTYTEIGGSLTVEVLSTGNTLPTAATITRPSRAGHPARRRNPNPST